MNNNKISPSIVYATEVEEFFWKDSDISVSEGFPVGIEVDNDSSVDLILCDDIYHEFKEEI